METLFFVYIMTNKPNGILYIGMTNDLIRRIFEHKNKFVEGFTKKYGLDKLVYYEIYQDPETALYREKCMKTWKRSWKVKHILRTNPEWKDLYPVLTGEVAQEGRRCLPTQAWQGSNV